MDKFHILHWTKTVKYLYTNSPINLQLVSFKFWDTIFVYTMGHYIRSNSICYISSKSEEKYEYEVKNMQIIIKENGNYYGSKSKTRAFLFGCSITRISGMNNTTRMRSPTTSGTIISHNLLFPLSGRKSLFSKSGICVPAQKVVHIIWSQNTV